MRVEELSLRASAWGEGPVWWQHALWQVDINGRSLIRYEPQSGREQIWEMDQRIGFALPGSNGKWIWGGDRGLFCLNLETGRSEPVVDPEAHNPHTRFNDAEISPDGRLFAGTIAMNKVKGSASLYRLDPDYSCHRVYANVTNSNGITWSPDGKTCTYIDTPSYLIRKFDYDATTGALSNERILFNTQKQVRGVPDGMCADAEGHLWIAFCHGGCVVRFNSGNGDILERIPLPAVETTSCCFGGETLEDLYITTGRSANHCGAADGKTFRVKYAGRGLPQTPFIN